METGPAEIPHTAETLPSPPQIAASRASAPVAPWWHTVIFIALLLGTSAAGAWSTRRLQVHEMHRALNYSLTLAWEWVLAAFVYWGLRRRRVPLRRVLGVRRPGWRQWIGDFGIALVFWFCALIALGTIALLLKPLHVNPESIRTVVSKLAPATPTQMVLWVAMSVTAGVVEEFIFRGYLQQQFAGWTGRVWAGVLASALLFGCAHGYEGVAGVLLIAVYGAFFSVLALGRRSLRAGMMAHAWHDALSGLVLFSAAHLAHRSLP